MQDEETLETDDRPHGKDDDDDHDQCAAEDEDTPGIQVQAEVGQEEQLGDTESSRVAGKDQQHDEMVKPPRVRS